MNRPVVIRIGASHEQLQLVERKVDALARSGGWSQELVFKVKLVVEEIGLNIINYGYLNDASGEIELRFQSDKKTLTIDIIDEAPAYNPLTEAPVPDLSLGIEERPVGGLGVQLVKEMMDEAGYAREENRNRLTLKTRLAT